MGNPAYISGTYVDNRLHVLHHGGNVFPCDREIEALNLWHSQALLLSSDTDCLSLWDAQGLVRTARVGVYPQDAAILGDTAYVCGGADGLLHLLSLPSLLETAAHPVPGMPERICLHHGNAYLLSLLPEPDVSAALLHLRPDTGVCTHLCRFPGLPGALAAGERGLWVSVSEQVLHYPWHAQQPDLILEGVSLAQQLHIRGSSLLLTDPIGHLQAELQPGDAPSIAVLPWDDQADVLLPK